MRACNDCVGVRVCECMVDVCDMFSGGASDGGMEIYVIFCVVARYIFVGVDV